MATAESPITEGRVELGRRGGRLDGPSGLSQRPLERAIRRRRSSQKYRQRDTIVDVLRNLIENALAHTGPGTEVIVEVSGEGTLTVPDNGPAYVW